MTINKPVFNNGLLTHFSKRFNINNNKLSEGPKNRSIKSITIISFITVLRITKLYRFSLCILHKYVQYHRQYERMNFISEIYVKYDRINSISDNRHVCFLSYFQYVSACNFKRFLNESL